MPAELLPGKVTVSAANQFLRQIYLREFNARFMVKASERGTAFVPARRKDLNLVFSLHHERVVARDNSVSFANRSWQLERTKFRSSLAGCRVTVHEHLDDSYSITFGPHVVGRYAATRLVEMMEKSGQKAALLFHTSTTNKGLNA